MKLSIAGLPVCIHSADAAWFAERYAAYERQDARPPMMEMTTQVLDTVPVPKGDPVEQIQAVSVVRLPDGRLCRYARGKDGQVLFAIDYTADYSRVDIRLWAGRQHPVFSQRDWEYLFTGYSFQNRLTVLGGGVLHSSSLAWRGHGIAFSANSGTGKSTHVGLWKQRFGDEVDIINDDKPAIVFDGVQPMLCGTPWSGKTALNCNRCVPLRAIVFLQRGEQNGIRRMDALEATIHLTGQIARPYYDAGLGERVVDFTQRLLHAVPIYCLTCNISQRAVETVIHEIFPQEEIEI